MAFTQSLTRRNLRTFRRASQASSVLPQASSELLLNKVPHPFLSFNFYVRGEGGRGATMPLVRQEILKQLSSAMPLIPRTLTLTQPPALVRGRLLRHPAFTPVYSLLRGNRVQRQLSLFSLPSNSVKGLTDAEAQVLFNTVQSVMKSAAVGFYPRLILLSTGSIGKTATTFTLIRPSTVAKRFNLTEVFDPALSQTTAPAIRTLHTVETALANRRKPILHLVHYHGSTGICQSVTHPVRSILNCLSFISTNLKKA